MMNEREFGVSFLEANITDNVEEGSSTLQARLENIPPSVGESQNALWVNYFKTRSFSLVTSLSAVFFAVLTQTVFAS